MKPVVLLLLLGFVAALPAGAQPRVATSRMSCAEASALVKREGDIRLATGNGGIERLVRDRSFCDILEIAELRFLSTRDNPQCPVGYRCKEPDYENWNWEQEAPIRPR